jgi:hypothetical protein
MKLNSKKIIFFLLVFYLCFQPMEYLVNTFYNTGLQSIYIYRVIYLEQIVFLLTVFLILTGTINVNKYINFHSRRAFLLYALVFLIINMSFFIVGLNNMNQYYSQSTFVLGRGFIFILLGLNIHVINDFMQEKKMRALFFSIAALYLALILGFSIFSPLASMHSWYLEGINNKQMLNKLDISFSYLYIADTAALLILLIISQLKQLNHKILLFLFGLFILILTSSRTSFLCFGLAGFFLLMKLFFNRNKSKSGLTFMLVLILIFLGFTFLNFFNEKVLVEYGDSYRFSFKNYQTDGSFIHRNLLFTKRISELENIWFLGSYMSDTLAGRTGTYFHNWLAFWSEYGILPFILSIILFVSSLKICVRQFIKDPHSSTNQLFFLWSIFIITAVIFSRSASFYYFWFVFFGSAMINRKFIRRPTHRSLIINSKNNVSIYKNKM